MLGEVNYELLVTQKVCSSFRFLLESQNYTGTYMATESTTESQLVTRANCIYAVVKKFNLKIV